MSKESSKQILDDYFAWSKGVQREVKSQADGKTWSSLIRRRLEAPIDRVWAAFTDPAKLALWLGKPSGDLRLGGTVTLDLSMPQTTEVKILTCQEPHLLRTTWRYGDWRPSEVELRLTSEGGSTQLELEHYLAPSRDDARGTGSGWEAALLTLDQWLHGKSAPSDVMHPAMDEVWTKV